VDRVEWPGRPDARISWLRSVIAGSCASSARARLQRTRWPRSAPKCSHRMKRSSQTAGQPGDSGAVARCNELNTYAQVRLVMHTDRELGPAAAGAHRTAVRCCRCVGVEWPS
jgi:hypothetical protein